MFLYDKSIFIEDEMFRNLLYTDDEHDQFRASHVDEVSGSRRSCGHNGDTSNARRILVGNPFRKPRCKVMNRQIVSIIGLRCCSVIEFSLR
jgi:hypothetical protein